MGRLNGPFPHRRAAMLIVLLAAALLGGCASGPPQPSAGEQRVASAESALAAGVYNEAARRFLQAADTAESPVAGQWRLRAALLYLKTGETQTARRLLEENGTNPANATVASLARLLRAALQLPQKAGRVRALLGEGPPDALPDSVVEQWLDTLARAERLSGHPLAAARTRLRRQAALKRSDARDTNRAALWDALLDLPMDTLREQVPARPDEFGGWLELAYALRSNPLHGNAIRQAGEDWIQRYPQHPAATSGFARTAVTGAIDDLAPPKRVALMLPLSGPLAMYGRAIEQGFMAAYYQAESDNRPELRVYDVGEAGEDALTAYRDAVHRKADLVVGPLTKQSLQRLSVWDDYPVPILALNRLDEPPKSNPDAVLPRSAGKPGETTPTPVRTARMESPYQFGLAPEDDAIAAARLATDRGLTRAVALTPDTDWGERVSTAFSDAMHRNGGTVLESGHFPDDADDFSDTIRAAFNLDVSERRYRAIRNRLRRNLEFEPRRRQDMQVVFIGAYPQQARLLKPQIRFHHGVGLPVIATSHAYDTDTGDAGTDVNGLVLVATPWILGKIDDRELAALKDSTVDALPSVSADQPRLVALGIDAFRLTGPIDILARDPRLRLPGLTGELSVDSDNVVHRGLDGARIANGHLEPLTRVQSEHNEPASDTPQ